jgi:hypothetical protein
MEQVIMMAMQTCQTYAEQEQVRNLTEYELLMYEQLCNMVRTYCKLHDLSGQEKIPEYERDAQRAREQHEEWLRAHQDDDKPKDDRPDEQV